jgi:sarcosine oxidase, subunit alpha
MLRPSSRRFRFGRASVEARAGETVLSAIGQSRWPSLVRSVRYHRPRGPFCGIGDCTGCLVRVNGVPNQRACRRVVEEGDIVRTENSWPGPRFDLAGALDLLLPRGVDTVRGLRRPAWATPLYQWVGRRLAGFGRAPDRAATAPPAPGRSISAEVTVVGAGPSGRAVAAALVRSGVRTLLLDRGHREGPGGALAGATGGVAVLGGATVTSLSAPRPGDGVGVTLLASEEGGRGCVVRSRAVVVATGAYDGGLLFEGSDRPGVVTADLALSPARPPLPESLVVGGGPRALEVLERLGDDVTAVAAFGEILPGVVRAATELGVPLYPRSRLVRSIGRSHVRALELSRRDAGGSFRLPCRSVVLAHRRLPNAQLAFQAGARRRWRDPPGAFYPEVDGVGRTNVPGVFVVGSAAVPRGAPAPRADEVAASVLGPSAPHLPSTTPVPSATPAERPDDLLAYYRELLREPRRGKWIVCPCEDVLLEELEAAVARGYRGMEVGMRYTGVGTGLCQGRYCLPEAIALLAVLEERAPTEVGYVTQRPPLVPTALGTLAGLRTELLAEGAG